ncbi:MAG: glycosyltransferase family 2 protein [Planctomycetota bacterium]|jgi:glycosyltransferase involved in cell wall biosynthesis
MTADPDLPRISLITPSFQQATFLERMLTSVQAQAYPNLEHIVLDGGSTDGTVEILRRHESSFAWWRSSPDGGQTEAINEGLGRATGDVVGWLNVDDLLLPGALRLIGRAFADPVVRATCGWAFVIDAADRLVTTRVFPQPTATVLCSRPLLVQPAIHWRREILDEIGLLDESLEIGMDLEYWVRMARRGIVPKLIPAYLAAHRAHDEQKSLRLMETNRAERAAILVGGEAEPSDLKAMKRRIPRLWRIKYRLLNRAAGWRLPIARRPLTAVAREAGIAT